MYPRHRWCAGGWRKCWQWAEFLCSLILPLGVRFLQKAGVTVPKEGPVCLHSLRQGKRVLTLPARAGFLRFLLPSTWDHSIPRPEGIWDLARVVLNVLSGISPQSKAVVVKVQHVSELPRWLFQPQISGPIPTISDSVDLNGAWESALQTISKVADAAGPGTTFWVAVV